MNSKELVSKLAQFEIKKAIKYYGIELTEEKIKYVYRNMPYIKYQMLKEYYNVIGRPDLWKKMEK